LALQQQLRKLITIMNMINQEDGYVPGPALSALETIVTFVVIPTALFLLISLITYAATAQRKKSSKSVITHIE
jgi:large-conductance mechanosensitive channel